MYFPPTSDHSLTPTPATGDLLPSESFPQWVKPCSGDVTARAGKTGRSSTRRPPSTPPARDNSASAAEAELMNAMQAYKEWSGRMFPTWSEVLEVLKSLGYQKSA